MDPGQGLSCGEIKHFHGGLKDVLLIGVSVKPDLLTLGIEDAILLLQIDQQLKDALFIGKAGIDIYGKVCHGDCMIQRYDS